MEVLFGETGPLARSVPGFAPRLAQSHMADAVADALERQQTLVVEAGTGTGKTYAYLVPALMSGRRVVISTGTLNLQDQLFYRDLPRVRQALGVPARVCLLKGRANYLCHYRLNKALGQPFLRPEWQRLEALQSWAQRTDTGELQEAGVLSANDALAPRVSSTADNCLGSRCPDFERCFVVKARRAAQSADVVVVNHHLLFADFALKEEGFGQILPGAEAVIIDEAHQLPEVASRFFGNRVSTRQLAELAQDTSTEAGSYGDLAELVTLAAELSDSSVLLEGRFAQLQLREKLDDFLVRPGVKDALDQTVAALTRALEVLKPLAERGPGLAACGQRAAELHARLEQMLESKDDAWVRWVETQGRAGSLHATPVRVSEGFQRLRETHPGAWIFTSATLSVGDDFSHFCGQLGLDDAKTLRLDSPFDFTAQARLYLPQGLPDPNDSTYTDRIVDAALPVIEASGGGVFFLCTSHRAVKWVARRLRAALQLPLFVQGEAARGDLLDGFAQAGNGVLVGTSSFWEGVDVKGPALRVVIIDRLPFTAPGDPVFEARLAAIRASGGEPFWDYQLPQAIIGLRQGMGRLIRDSNDHGLMMLCDPRVRHKPYGKRVLASLPAVPVLTDQKLVLAWLGQLEKA